MELMRRHALIVLAAILACVAPAARADEAPAHVKEAAKAAPEGDLYGLFIDVKGKVKWRANAGQPWKDAAVDDRLPVGGELRTGLHGSRCALRVGLNATVLVDSGSVFSIPMTVKDGDQLRTLAGLKSGRADFKVENTGLGADFKVATPSSVLAVRGTGFSLSYGALKGPEVSGARTNAVRAIELRYALGSMPQFLSGQARSSLAIQNPVKHALLTAIGPPPLGSAQSESEREQQLTQKQTGTSGSSPDSLQAQQSANSMQSGRADATRARSQYYIALEQSLSTQLELSTVLDEYNQCTAEFATVEAASADMGVLEEARGRAVDGLAEGETVSTEVTDARAQMLADRDEVFEGFSVLTDAQAGTVELTPEQLDALVAAVSASTDLFGDRADRLAELGVDVSTAAADATAALDAASAAETSFAGALALIDALVPQMSVGNQTITTYQQLAQAALDAVQAIYDSNPSGEINSILADTLSEIAAIAERAAQAEEFLAEAEEQLATSQSYADRLAIGRAIELQQDALDADAQMQLLLTAAGDLVDESENAQLAFLELDRAIDAMVLSRSNAASSRAAAAEAQTALGNLFTNHELAVTVASSYIQWESGVAAAQSGATAAEGFHNSAIFNRDAAQTSFNEVVALAAAGDFEAAHFEAIQTDGFADAAEVASAGAAQAAIDAAAGSNDAIAGGGAVLNALNSPEAIAAYEADAAAALAAAGAVPSGSDPDGEGALGAAGSAVAQANEALANAQAQQADAEAAVGAYGQVGGDVLAPNNALVVLAGQIQNAIDDLEAASQQYANLQAYAQTWASSIVIGNIQSGIAAALANAGQAAQFAEAAQAAAEEARQFADDAATAAVPQGTAAAP